MNSIDLVVTVYEVVRSPKMINLLGLLIYPGSSHLLAGMSPHKALIRNPGLCSRGSTGVRYVFHTIRRS